MGARRLHGDEQAEAEADPGQERPLHARPPPLLQHKADGAVRALQDGARRGELARSRVVFLCYKGQQPRQLAKTRVHVDGGSLVFNAVVRNAPVLPQKSHSLVSREVRDASLQTMIGVRVCEVEAEDPECEAPPPIDDEDAATA